MKKKASWISHLCVKKKIAYVVREINVKNQNQGIQCPDNRWCEKPVVIYIKIQDSYRYIDDVKQEILQQNNTVPRRQCLVLDCWRIRNKRTIKWRGKKAEVETLEKVWFNHCGLKYKALKEIYKVLSRKSQKKPQRLYHRAWNIWTYILTIRKWWHTL